MKPEIPKPTEQDYRAILAFLWTILTFATIFYAMLKGWNPQDIISIIGSMFALDIIFVKGYFDAKESA